jgi:uncharacterized protein (TIGR03435 family)
VTLHPFVLPLRLALVLGAACLLAIDRPAAQTIPGGSVDKSTPTFDVASIRRTTATNIIDNNLAYQPGRFLVRNQNMRIVIAMVYGQPSAAGLSDSMLERVIGGPRWLDTDGYDIDARTDPGVSEPTVRAMVRALVEDRFRLKVRTEQREMPIYTLVQTGDGAKLGTALTRSSGSDCSESTAGPGVPPCGLGRPRTTETGLTWSSRHATPAQLAGVVEGFLDRPVVDRTGLAGGYGFTFAIPPQALIEIMVPDASDPGRKLPKVSSLLQEQLGLRLESARGPIDVWVIESIERPSEN